MIQYNFLPPLPTSLCYLSLLLCVLKRFEAHLQGWSCETKFNRQSRFLGWLKWYSDMKRHKSIHSWYVFNLGVRYWVTVLRSRLRRCVMVCSWNLGSQPSESEVGKSPCFLTAFLGGMPPFLPPSNNNQRLAYFMTQSQRRTETL